jgi:glutathione S-transferase
MSSSGLVLWGHVLSAESYAVRLTLALAGMQAEHRVVDWPGGGTDAPAFRALSPTGTLPVLEDGGQRVTGAEACLRHLAAGPAAAFAAGRDVDGAAVDQWLAFAGGPLAAASRLRAARLFDRPHDGGLVREARRAFTRIDDRLVEQRLSGDAFLAGGRPTIADLACFPLLALADDVGIPLDGFAGIACFVQDVIALPGFVPMPGIFALPANA